MQFFWDFLVILNRENFTLKLHKLHKRSKKPVNTPVRATCATSFYQASHTVRHSCRGKEITLDFRTQYFQIWQTVWNLHKKYFGIRQQDEQRWKQLNNECESIDNQYSELPERKFAQSLLLAIIGELEREARHGETAGTVTPTQS